MKRAYRYLSPTDAVCLATIITVFLVTGAIVNKMDKPVEVEEFPPLEIVRQEEVVLLPCVVEEDVEPEVAYTEEELEQMALVIYQEAGGDACSDETRLMVGNVVLNRVADDRYPDTIEEVLLQERQYGRLHWTGLVWPERAVKAEEAHAVERAYKCAEEVLNGVRLLPDDVIFQAEFEQGTEIVAHQDGFYFCR